MGDAGEGGLLVVVLLLQLRWRREAAWPGKARQQIEPSGRLAPRIMSSSRDFTSRGSSHSSLSLSGLGEGTGSVCSLCIASQGLALD
jgi:hypothetical protein